MPCADIRRMVIHVFSSAGKHFFPKKHARCRGFPPERQILPLLTVQHLLRAAQPVLKRGVGLRAGLIVHIHGHRGKGRRKNADIVGEAEHGNKVGDDVRRKDEVPQSAQNDGARPGRQILALLQDIQRTEGVAILMNSHNLDQSRAVSTRLLGLHAGQIVLDGAPAAVTDADLTRIYGDAESEAAP